ncbi:SDR family oxidoreductase [Acidisoma cellulosilytica]|uniref:SDR family oxidoreductase n=1 Tax=Acidisoma cellulosilyticum TaxID=2802395 RepID=A0A964E527_9PROT|nr:SDR family oxidoreductase [Acidisoma cellulosilyticum]MCB8882270.1 SDR family oxidoreductase [Acidisoma cellulosilyticum]
MYMDKSRLDGRLAFVTGGGGGIGLAAAEALSEAGAKVIIGDRNAEMLELARQSLADKGYVVETQILDVSDPDAVSAIAREIEARHGPVEILVASAGITSPDTAAEAIQDDVWRRIVDVDLNGVFWCCRAFGTAMLARGRGSIITLGSISGLISNKPQRQAHYNSAKAGVHHLTKSLAGEWAARGVRVNSVAPTYVDTPMSSGSFGNPAVFPIWMDMTPMGRVARADEIASVILFLAGDASSAMTGAVVPVDCGYTIW